MESAPISVIIPAYNRAGTLGRALASIDAQSSVRPAEVIVVDDGSSDATADVAHRFGARVVRHQQNRGVSAARNSGVEAADQPWLAFLDSDDEWLPSHLSNVWSMRDGNLLVADSALRCGSDPRRFKRHGPLTRGAQRLEDPAPLLYPGNLIPTSGALVRREAVVRAGGFRVPFGAEDLDLWLRVLDLGPASLSPRVGVIYHLHTEQLSGDDGRMRDDHLAVARQFAGRPWFSEALIERWRGLVIWDRVRHQVRRRSFADAFRTFLQLLRGRQRIYGATRFAVARTRSLRQNAKLARDGQPSVAVLVRNRHQRERVLGRYEPRPVSDLSDRSRISACAQLFHRPTAVAVVDSWSAYLLLKLAGTRTIRVR